VEHVGIDLGKKESQVAVITESGELIERRMRTERDRLRQFFAARPSTTSSSAPRSLDDAWPS
jgi:hypothetical protein